MSMNKLSLADLAEIRKSSIIFGTENEMNKIRLLKSLKLRSASNASRLNQYQHALLFLSAYPDSEEIQALVSNELLRINTLASGIIKKSKPSKQDTFSGTGLRSSYFIGSFSHDICLWLHKNYPDCVSFHSYGDSERSPQELFSLSLLPAESWLLENPDMPLKKWTKSAGVKNQNNSLEWILKATMQPKLPHAIRDLLFDSLQLYITFEIKDQHNALSLIRSPKGKYFFHKDKLLKSINIKDTLNKNIPRPLNLKEEEKKDYIRSARFALMHLSRETDTVSYCHPEGLEVFDLERGFSIALFYLPPDRRNAIDSYVGYMIYKNRIPCGYGGAWIFGDKAKVGLNIFPTFRGGESAFLFSQILRLYKNRFRLKYFEAEPYQIGLHNPEGIASGAFWFYYKIGFRPHQKELRKIADEEYEKIEKDKKYRTTAATLKFLARSFMFLDCKKPGNSIESVIPDSINVSKVISGIIAEEFKGDRALALEYFRKEVKKKTRINSINSRTPNEKLMYEAMLPLLFLLCRDIKLDKNQKNILLQLVLTKAEDTEFSYTQKTIQIQKWWSRSIKQSILLSKEV